MENQLLSPENQKAIEAIGRRIPNMLLAKLESDEQTGVYIAVLNKLMEESLPEGSTILQVLIVERAAFYFVKMHALELKGADFAATSDYKFWVQEYNRNLEILRQLAIRNLPAQQARLLAKKTISVIERVVKNPGDRDQIIKELVQEYTIEIPVTGFKAAEVKV